MAPTCTATSSAAMLLARRSTRFRGISRRALCATRSAAAACEPPPLLISAIMEVNDEYDPGHSSLSSKSSGREEQKAGKRLARALRSPLCTGAARAHCGRNARKQTSTNSGAKAQRASIPPSITAPISCPCPCLCPSYWPCRAAPSAASGCVCKPESETQCRRFAARWRLPAPVTA